MSEGNFVNGILDLEEYLIHWQGIDMRGRWLVGYSLNKDLSNTIYQYFSLGNHA